MAQLKGIDISEAAVGNDDGTRKRHEKATREADDKQMMKSGSAAKQIDYVIGRAQPKNTTITRFTDFEEKPMKRESRRNSRSKGRR